MTDAVNDQLLNIVRDGANRRQRQVDRAMKVWTPYERSVIREAAVMGYVLGVQAAGGEAVIPKDSQTVGYVIMSCASMDSLYPFIAAAAEGRHPSQAGFAEYMVDRFPEYFQQPREDRA